MVDLCLRFKVVFKILVLHLHNRKSKEIGIFVFAQRMKHHVLLSLLYLKLPGY